jgi:hypothetical protein
MKTVTIYVPEVGDSVLWRGQNCKITAKNHHCSNCEDWWDIGVPGECLLCPNVSDFQGAAKWDEDQDIWVLPDDFDD